MGTAPLTTIRHSQPDLLLVKDNLAAYFRQEIISGPRAVLQFMCSI
jgi:hypothetical protein